MDQASITPYLIDTFADVQVETSDGSFFFFYGAERKFPFATLVTKDSYDSVSNPGSSGRLPPDIGISKSTFLSLFGAQPARPGEADVADAGHDFTAPDRLMPHPVYGSMFWILRAQPKRGHVPKQRAATARRGL